MSETSNRIVQKLWSYCNVLRDDGLSCQDYLRMEGVALEQHYREALQRLEPQRGMLGLIFEKAQNKIDAPPGARRPGRVRGLLLFWLRDVLADLQRTPGFRRLGE